MKRFLKGLLMYGFIVVIFVITIVFIYWKRCELPFLSNSISHNAKAKFLIEKDIDWPKRHFFIIGSSMSLNNVDAVILSEKIGSPVLNLASWGMKFNDFNEFPIWDKENTIIYNIHFTDFGNSAITYKPGYPFTDNKTRSFINILQDFRTYVAQVEDFSEIKSHKQNDFYQALNFDSCGSVVFIPKVKFGLDSSRWEIKRDSCSISFMDKFVDSIVTKRNKCKELVVFFSPVHPSFYKKENADLITYLEKRLIRLPHVRFYNNYDNKEFVDADFVDYCHLSGEGAVKYTQLMINQLKSTE